MAKQLTKGGFFRKPVDDLHHWHLARLPTSNFQVKEYFVGPGRFFQLSNFRPNGPARLEQNHNLVSGIPAGHKIFALAQAAESCLNPPVDFGVAPLQVQQPQVCQVQEAEQAPPCRLLVAESQEGLASPHPKWIIPGKLLHFPAQQVQFLLISQPSAQHSFYVHTLIIAYENIFLFYNMSTYYIKTLSKSIIN